MFGPHSASPLHLPTVTATSRICTQCQEEKPRDHFSSRQDGKRQRLTSRCKECRNDNYKQNPQRARDRANEHYHKNKALICAGLREKYTRNPVRNLFNAAKNRAKLGGIPFDITVDDVVVPDLCPVLGIPLVVNKRAAKFNSPTLDRIIGDLGYVRGNVMVISYRANTIKSDATVTELRRMADFYERLLGDK